MSATRRKEFGASAFVGLKSGSSDTRITSADAASPDSAVIRKNAYGSASTNGFTTAERKSVFCGTAGSSVMRSAVLEIGPEKPFVSTVRVTFPSAPGLMTLSNSGTVQPQDGFTSVMCRSAVPVFLRTNTCLIGSPFATCPTSFLSSTTTSFGPAAGLRGLRLGGEGRRQDQDRERGGRERGNESGMAGGSHVREPPSGTGPAAPGPLKHSEFEPCRVYVGPAGPLGGTRQQGAV